MKWVGAVFVYGMIWWLVLFAVLPWGVRVPENPEQGHASSAPEKPMLLRKLIITSVIALFLFGIVYYVWFYVLDEWKYAA